MADLTYTCPCGTVHAAGVYGAAHWHEILVHTCAACGRRNEIRRGRVLHSTAPPPATPASDRKG